MYLKGEWQNTFVKRLITGHKPVGHVVITYIGIPVTEVLKCCSRNHYLKYYLNYFSNQEMIMKYHLNVPTKTSIYTFTFKYISTTNTYEIIHLINFKQHISIMCLYLIIYKIQIINFIFIKQ